jgi:hypothetical protein
MFQRETNYVETIVSIPRATTGTPAVNAPWFQAPTDILEVIEVTDKNGYTLVSNSYIQFRRNQEVWSPNYWTSTPAVYEYRLSGRNSGNIQDRSGRTWRPMADHQARLFTILDNRLIVHPDDITETALTMAYIPDLSAISSMSPAWNLWFPSSNFMPLFISTGMMTELRPYEYGILNFAIAEFIRKQGSANFKFYEDIYRQEIQRAINNKPTLAKEMSRDYFFAPWS